MKTIKVEPWGEGQGEFVEINADDFNPDFHIELGGKKLSAKEKKALAEAEKKAADDAANLLELARKELTDKGVAFTDEETLEELQAKLAAAE
jgi:hypothetical protein